MNDTKLDPRVVKTKKALKTSLEVLLQDKPFDKLSVCEICNGAYVNRVTFYSHYNDKYDLLQDYIYDLKEDIMKKTKEDYLKSNELNLESFCNALATNIIDICVENKSILKAFTKEGNQMVIFMIEDYAMKELKEFYLKYTNNYNNIDKDFLIPFIVGGSSKIINEWLSYNIEKDISKFKITVKKLIHDGLLVFKN